MLTCAPQAMTWHFRRIPETIDRNEKRASEEARI